MFNVDFSCLAFFCWWLRIVYKHISILYLSHLAQWKSVKSTVPLPAAGGALAEAVKRGEEEDRKEEEDVVPIVICSSEERMGATMAAVNSVHSNTEARLFFYIVTLRDAVKLTRFLIPENRLS